MTTPTPEPQARDEHDDLCEYRNPCRCAERRDPAAPIDPTLLKMRIRRVRQATTAPETVKHTLIRYVSEHAPSTCGYAGVHFDCTSEIDGFVLFSCGHHVFTCRTGGSRVLSEIRKRRASICTDPRFDLHAPGVIATAEWQGLA